MTTDPGSVDGRSHGPVRASVRVVARQRHGAYVSLSVSAPRIAEQTRPGQFVNLAVEAPHCLLRRPFSVYGVGPDGTLRVVLDPHGPGTGWLAGRARGDVVDVVGPLGTPFAAPDTPGPCLLVGGGYGAAPLFFLAEELQRRDRRVDLVVGAASADRLFDLARARELGTSLRVTTDDGSAGQAGVVTDVFDEAVEASGSVAVFACGPMPMLREVSRAAARHALDCQVAVEEHMACGVGVCWTCVVPVFGDDGRAHMRRSCLDGPVFDAPSIAWEDSRWRTHEPASTFMPTPAAPAGAGGP